MAKEKKMYAVKEIGGRMWENEISFNSIKRISHYGSGTEMANDCILIEFDNFTEMEVDEIIFK